MQHTEIFKVLKTKHFQSENLAQTLIVGTRKNRLGEAVLKSTHDLCFGEKIRKIGIPLNLSFNI